MRGGLWPSLSSSAVERRFAGARPLAATGPLKEQGTGCWCRRVIVANDLDCDSRLDLLAGALKRLRSKGNGTKSQAPTRFHQLGRIEGFLYTLNASCPCHLSEQGTMSVFC